MLLGAQRHGGHGHTELSRRERADVGWLTDQSLDHVRDHRARSQRHPQPDERRWLAEVAQLQGGAEPDEEERTEEALGQPEELPGQAAGLADRGNDEPSRSPPA